MGANLVDVAHGEASSSRPLPPRQHDLTMDARPVNLIGASSPATPPPASSRSTRPSPLASLRAGRWRACEQVAAAGEHDHRGRRNATGSDLSRAVPDVLVRPGSAASAAGRSSASAACGGSSRSPHVPLVAVARVPRAGGRDPQITARTHRQPAAARRCKAAARAARVVAAPGRRARACPASSRFREQRELQYVNFATQLSSALRSRRRSMT